jgi:hypothetical protein
MEATEQLERDAEARREKLKDSLDNLKERLSVDQLLSEAGRFVGIDDAGETLRDLARHARANPIAIAMVGIGVGMLIFGGADKRSPQRPWTSVRHRRDGDEGVDDQDADYGGTARSAISSLGQTAGRLTQAAGSGIRESVDTMVVAGDDVFQVAARQVARYPLVIGGLALAAGTLVGAGLPATRTEDRLVGRPSDRVREQAKAASVAVGQRATAAVQRTYDTAIETARREGLLPAGDETFTAKVAAVADAAIDEATRQIDPLLHGAKDR